MFIEKFEENIYEELERRIAQANTSNNSYFFLDGAFVPGLRKRFASQCRDILFSRFPGCSEEDLDASPFLMPIMKDDKRSRSLLRYCNGWPMVSFIETPESLEKLGARLAAWCIVETGGQRFNFRFADTRRLGAVFETLTLKQRAELTGPAVHWSYISRSGNWTRLEILSSNAGVSIDPILDEKQFARLVDDSYVDELMILLSDRGREVFSRPLRSHTLVSLALQVATVEHLEKEQFLNWCEYFWLKDELCDPNAAIKEMHSWRT